MVAGVGFSHVLNLCADRKRERKSASVFREGRVLSDSVLPSVGERTPANAPV